MSKKALELLNANPASQSNGFFLQIEGASIDKQDHAGNACGQIGETDDFDQAISYVLQNVDLSDTLVIVTADHAHTSQILTAQPAYALSTVLKTADGNNMVVSYGTAQEDSRDEEGGYNGGDMEHTGTQLRIAASGPGAQRVIGLTDQNRQLLHHRRRARLGHHHRPAEGIVRQRRSQGRHRKRLVCRRCDGLQR